MGIFEIRDNSNFLKIQITAIHLLLYFFDVKPLLIFAVIGLIVCRVAPPLYHQI